MLAITFSLVGNRIGEGKLVKLIGKNSQYSFLVRFGVLHEMIPSTTTLLQADSSRPCRCLRCMTLHYCKYFFLTMEHGSQRDETMLSLGEEIGEGISIEPLAEIP